MLDLLGLHPRLRGLTGLLEDLPRNFSQKPALAPRESLEERVGLVACELLHRLEGRRFARHGGFPDREAPPEHLARDELVGFGWLREDERPEALLLAQAVE